MDLKPRLKAQLERARKASETWLAAFEMPEQWTFQVAPGLNHALWFAGHMAVVDNMLMRMISPEDHRDQKILETKFGIKSVPTSNPGDYPPPAEVLSVMRERREKLLAILDRLSEVQLAQPVPPGSPPMFSDIASVFELAIWHEGVHAGQMTIARRALGHSPAFS